MPDRVEVNPAVMQGKLLLRKLGEGATVGDLLDAYPHLTASGVQAALSFVAAGV